eukprot:CAMPEP_0194229612 /NCGR_PEP_ID=MMETSP0156-20130528/43983_1 /TAXON_ID=33649 /ORGANISM="Thalassionema nitzschioides, Strain L26-B" /LENGTH=291 /DNA_ID=CAMNT_0038962169 /DNA_START=175 /DNA_END=1050 /DNA_ORIENTATION=-
MAREELGAMLNQESSCYSIEFDYLDFTARENDGPTRKDQLTEGFRRLVCGWLFQVVDHFQYDRDIAAIATYYLDQTTVIQMKRKGKICKRREYQLIGVTSLYLAIKLHGGHENGSRPDIRSFANLSNGQFSIEEIERTELEILRLTSWRVNPPSSSRILVNLIYFIPENWEGSEKSSKAEILSIFEISRYLTELALHVSKISFNYKASEIALASVLCALEALKDKQSIPDWVRSEFISNITDSTTLTLSPVMPLCTLLNDLFNSVPSTNECNDISTDAADERHSPVSVRDV